MRLTEVYQLNEGQDTQRARAQVSRIVDKALADAEKQLAAGHADVATSVVRDAAGDVYALMLALAEKMIGGNIK